MKLFKQEAIILALSLITFNSITQGQTQKPTSEFLCSAQCIYINEAAKYVDFGYSVEGWSTYSQSEAFTDLKAKCKYPNVLVLAVAGSRKQTSDVTSSETSDVSATANATQDVSIGSIRGRTIRDVNVYQNANASVDSYSSSYLRVYTEDNFEFDVSFANAINACKESPIHPEAGQRYIDDHPIGG